MPYGGTLGRGRRSPGVLDGGVVLARLDRRSATHTQAVRLFSSSARGRVQLHVSAVTLVDVLRVAASYIDGVGLDPVLLLRSFGIAVHAPDAETARAVAGLLPSAALTPGAAFAAGTAARLGARLYTTDADLASAMEESALAVTLL